MIDRSVIAAKLIKLRGAKSREEVAVACGISLSALAMYETGERVPRDEIKIKLSKYYETSLEALFFES